MSDVNIDAISLQRLTLSTSIDILSLPVELIISIIHHIRDESLLAPSFSTDPIQSMRIGQLYQDTLLALSLLHRNWTPIAQSELFKTIILTDARKTQLLLDLVKSKPVFREYLKNTTGLRFGYDGGRGNFERIIGFRPELAAQCPNVKEISCYGLYVALEDFKNFRRLETLNLFEGSLAQSDAELSIGHLSLDRVHLNHLIDTNSTPLLHNLTYNCYQHPYIASLLPQITSLILHSHLTHRAFRTLLLTAPKVVDLSLKEANLINLSWSSNEAIILQSQIEILRLSGIPYHCTQDIWKHDNIISLIQGSQALKEVYLDKSSSFMRDDMGMMRRLKDLIDVCRNKGIALWAGHKGREIRRL